MSTQPTPTSHLELIAALLRKAEGTDNEHEAEAFLTRAQTLATRHSIDLAIARAHTAKAEAREEPVEETVRLGKSGQHGLAQYLELFCGIARVNDLKCLQAKNKTAVYPLGFPSDIEVTKALYASLLVQMVQAGDAYVKSGAYKGQTFERQVTVNTSWYGPSTEWVTRPVDARVARRSFYDGFISRVTSRLAIAKSTAVDNAQEADVAPESTVDNPQALTTTALALRDKADELDVFYNATLRGYGISPTRRSRGRADTSTTARGARSAGSAAGDNARLSSQPSIGR